MQWTHEWNFLTIHTCTTRSIPKEEEYKYIYTNLCIHLKVICLHMEVNKYFSELSATRLFTSTLAYEMIYAV
jgi:hypothetical protein